MKRNILLVFTDQQRFDTIGALGNPVITTPTFDKMVREGVAFTSAYSNCPVCVPARFSMLTGLLPHQHDCTQNEYMPRGYTSIMEILRDNGYQTHGVGKMHFTFKDDMFAAKWGFESRVYSEDNGTVIAGEENYKQFLEENGYTHVIDANGVRSEMYYIPQVSQMPAELHESTWIADKSIEFLKNRDNQRPFFMMTSFINPHPPFDAPVPWNKLHRGPEMQPPKNPRHPEEFENYWSRIQNRYKRKDSGDDEYLTAITKATYYNSISFIDYNLGRLLAYMTENKLLENTTVIFTSDHGEMLGDYGCWGKRSFMDSSGRIPMLLLDPEVEKGQQCTVPVSLIDVFSTMLDSAGLPQESRCHGTSLRAIANGQEREFVTGQYSRNEFAVYMLTSERYKYIYSVPDDKEYFFDRLSDPQELNNKAHSAMFTRQKDNLKQKLIAFLAADGYDAAIEKGKWRAFPPQHMKYEQERYIYFQDPAESIPHIPGYEREYHFKYDPALRNGISLHISHD